MSTEKELSYMEQHDLGTTKDLVFYRLDSAKEDLNAAQSLYNISLYKAANNRAYYAIFHAINAIHALNGKAYKRHKDAIANFNKEYIKTEIFPKSLGKGITGAEEIRHASDYDDFYFATEKEARKQIDLANEVVSLIEKYCNEKLA
jgi:uncharacterized protein (UPF0332 family)